MKRIVLAILLMAQGLLTQAQYVQNPILAGFYPDPSICRAGEDYYIVNSSFAYFPGLPLFHSKDLVNWKQIGYALDRPEQLNLDNARISGGLYAPAISFHNGTFYIVCTEVGSLGNFVITAKDPKGPWSLPVKLPQVNGIDPALFFEGDKAWIVYNSIPPDNISLHNGHRTIRQYAFDPVKLQVIGEERILINGGTDMAKKPVWIEGPHILKKDDWYFLICAEGGTGYNHSEVVFRSKSPEGPFVTYEKNPILTQRHLDPTRKDPITTTGHADLVEGPDGKWWGIFLGCRPYDGDHYNTGRETFIAPVSWETGWPVFDLGGETVKYQYPIAGIKDKKSEAFNGNYHFKDGFDNPVLNMRYRFLRTPRSTWYSLTDYPGHLILNTRPETCEDKANPSFIGFHQPHLKGEAITSVFFSAKSENEKAGLLLFQNDKVNYFLALTNKGGMDMVELWKGKELIASAHNSRQKNKPTFLRIEAKGDYYTFSYGPSKKKWTILKDKVDARELSTKTAGGFVGCLYALYTTSNGAPSSNKARYHHFEINNKDDIYK